MELVISKEIEIPKAINLEVFKGLKPGLTIGEYNWLLGKPHNTSIDDEGVNVYEFRKPFGIIKVKKGYHRLLAIHKKSRTYLSIMKISVAVIMGFIFF